MTKFEFERMQAVFEYLDKSLLAEYSYELNSGDEDLVRKVNGIIARRAEQYDRVKQTLKYFLLYGETDAAYQEKLFNSEGYHHRYCFAVEVDAFTRNGHQYIGMPFTERAVDGESAEGAEETLRNRLALESCYEPEDFKMQLLAQFY